MESIEFVGGVTWCPAIVDIGFVQGRGIVVTVDELRPTCLPCEAVVIRELDFTEVISASLRDDVDGPVGSFIAVECCCRRIFQDDNALHFLWTDVRNVAFDAVNHNQWRRTIE